VSEIVAVDAVEGMTQIAKLKSRLDKRVSVSVMNGHNITYPSQRFDTVVDTFGLCSYDDPCRVLDEMKRVCKADGRILLIEHGRGHYGWINNILDNGACNHAQNWGCIWNKDILNLVEQAGLEIIDVSRFHFGTTFLIEARIK
jgi:methyltransferase OMS1